MIVLRSVTKTYGRWRRKQNVLHNVDAVFEAKGNYVIFGLPKSGKTTLLNLLCGITAPTRGTVARYGRVGFTVGLPGIAHFRYSGRELAVLLANLYEADADEIIEFTTSFSELGSDMRRPISTLDQTSRSRLFVTLGYALPLDFYLFDGSVGAGDEHFRKKYRAAFEARRREAGTIWVTRNDRNAEMYGTKGGVLHDGKLELFDTLDEALHVFRIHRRAAERGTLGHARDLVRTGETAEARSYLREYLADRRDDIAAYELLAELALQAGDYGEAEAVCRAALKSSPNAVAIHFTLARIAEHQRKYADVVSHARNALEIDPAHYHGQRLLAKAYEALGLDNEAAATLGDIATQHNNLRNWLPAIHANAKAGNWEQALSSIDGAIASFGPNANTALADLRIRALFETGRLKDVEDALLALGEHDLEKALSVINQLLPQADALIIVHFLNQLHLKFDLAKNVTSRNLLFLLRFVEKEAAKRSDGQGAVFLELLDQIRPLSAPRPPSNDLSHV